MPIKFERRWVRRGVLGLVLLGLLIGRGPALARNAVANWAAVASITLCGAQHLPGHPTGDTVTHTADTRAWWQLARARCADDTAGTSAALQAVVQQSSSRLDVLRALAPSNVAVAQQAVDRYPDRAMAQLWLGDAQRVAGATPAAISAYERGGGFAAE